MSKRKPALPKRWPGHSFDRAEIESLIDRLRRDLEGFDGEDIERIERRLETLGLEQEDEDEERKQMRLLLTRQREMALRWNVRMEQGTAMRLALLRLLEELWAELQALDSRATPGIPIPPEEADRVREVCARAERGAVASGSLEAIPPEQLGELPTLEEPKTRG